MSKNLEKYYNNSDNTDRETISAFRFRLYWLFSCLSFLQDSGGYAISRPNNLELHLGCHTCWLTYFKLVFLWCGQMVGCSVGRCTKNQKQGVTRLPSPRMRGRTALRFSASSSQNWLNDQNCVSSSSTRIQTGKYEIGSVPIPVEDRTCLVCKQNHVEDEQHFLMFWNGCSVLRQELINFISNEDVAFVNLTAHDGIKY